MPLPAIPVHSLRLRTFVTYISEKTRADGNDNLVYNKTLTLLDFKRYETRIE